MPEAASRVDRGIPKGREVERGATSFVERRNLRLARSAGPPAVVRQTEPGPRDGECP